MNPKLYHIQLYTGFSPPIFHTHIALTFLNTNPQPKTELKLETSWTHFIYFEKLREKGVSRVGVFVGVLVKRGF